MLARGLAAAGGVQQASEFGQRFGGGFAVNAGAAAAHQHGGGRRFEEIGSAGGGPPFSRP
jgi:hypothetical protein